MILLLELISGARHSQSFINDLHVLLRSFDLIWQISLRQKENKSDTEASGRG